MRILLVNRHFGNEHVPTARMLGDLASAFIDQGDEVVVLTAKSSYTDTAVGRDAANGAKVHYVSTFGEKYRLIAWILFLIQASLRVPLMRWDRCILLTDPPFLAALSILLSPIPKKHSRVFWWTMDLYPEILVSSGRISESGVVHTVLKRVNAMAMRRLEGSILLGDCQLARMREYSAWNGANYIIVPPWDRRPIEKVARPNNRFLKAFGLTEKKVALYAGNLGEGHTFVPLLNAAEELARSGRDDWAIVFVIRGSKKGMLQDAAKDVPSIMILDYQPPEWTSDLLSSAHVHLITMNEGSKGLVVPSKLYGVLQTDAPVLFLGPQDADTALEIERYRAGETLDGTPAGDEVVATLDRLYAQSIEGSLGKREPDDTGPDQIAVFVKQGAAG